MLLRKNQLLAVLFIVSVVCLRTFFMEKTKVESYDTGKSGIFKESLENYNVKTKYFTLNKKKQLKQSQEYQNIIARRGGVQNLQLSDGNWQMRQRKALNMSEDQLAEASDQIRNDAYVNHALGSEDDDSDAIKNEIVKMDQQIESKI